MPKIIAISTAILLLSLAFGVFIAASADSLHVFETQDGDYTVQLLSGFLERLPMALAGGLLLAAGLLLILTLVTNLLRRDSLLNNAMLCASALLPFLFFLLIPLRYLDGLGSFSAFLFLLTGPMQPALLALLSVLSLYLLLLKLNFSWLHGLERGKFLRRFTANSIAIVIFIVLAVFYLISTPLFLENSVFGGDQPHYLVVTHSMLEDGDIYIEDDHQSGIVDSWTPVHTEPQYFKRTTDNQVIPFHRIGLPLLAVIPYWLGGKTGAVLLMGLLSALSAALTFVLSEKITGNRRASLWATAFIALTTPAFLLSFQFFSEVPAACITLLVLNMIIRSDENDPPLLPWLIPFLIWTLPWLHARDMITALALTAFLLFRMRAGLATHAGVLALSLVLALGIPLFNYAYYGTFSLVAEMGSDSAGAFGLMNVVNGLGGMFFDQEFGMLLYNPGLILVFPGLISLFRRDPGTTIWLILIAGFSVGPNLLYRMWWGGGSSPGRYYVAVIYLAAIPIARLLAYNRRFAVRRLFFVLFLIGVIFAAGLVINNDMMVNDRDGSAKVLTAASAHTVDAVEWLPSWFSGPERSWLMAGWLVLTIAAVSLLIIAATRLLPGVSLSSAKGVLLALGLALLVSAFSTPIAESITPGEPNQFQPTSHQLDRLYLERERSGKWQRTAVTGRGGERPLPPLRHSVEHIYSTAGLSPDPRANRRRSKLLPPSERLTFYGDTPLWMGRYRLEISLRAENEASSSIVLQDLGSPPQAKALVEMTVEPRQEFKTYSAEFQLQGNSPGLLLLLESTGNVRFQHVSFRPLNLVTADSWPYPEETFSGYFWHPGDYLLVTSGLDLFRPANQRFWTWGDYQGTLWLMNGGRFNTVKLQVHSKPGVRLTVESANDGAELEFGAQGMQTIELKPPVRESGSFWITSLEIKVDGHFIPSELNPESGDNRKLGVNFRLVPQKQ